MAKLAESERRQAEHDSEMQKVDEPEARRSSAAETMQAEAAKALRASHLQACAEACAKGYHRGCASPAPSVGSVASVGSSHLLVGGGNYSKFSGLLPDHMPPAPEPTSEMLRSSSSQALLCASIGARGGTLQV